MTIDIQNELQKAMLENLALKCALDRKREEIMEFRELKRLQEENVRLRSLLEDK